MSPVAVRREQLRTSRAEPSSTRSGDGIYPYETRAGTRYYFKYRKSDGRSATKRGFASPRAARRERERTVVSAAMGEQLSTTETFGEFFDSWLAKRRAYLEPGTYTDYDVHGRHRLASLRSIKLTKLSTQTVESWLAGLAAEERWAPKTINNALATLVACLNDAARKGKLPRNPAARVQRLPAEHIERDYLRLHEIPAYLDGCEPAYRPLAELLIATGLRISRGAGAELERRRLRERGDSCAALRQARWRWLDQGRPLPLGRFRTAARHRTARCEGAPAGAWRRRRG